MFTVYTASTELVGRRPIHNLHHFRPVYYGMQFRAASPEQPARQITALFARPGTSKRNKDLRRYRFVEMYAPWTPVHRKSGNDSV